LSLVDSSLNCNLVVSCDPVISMAVSFTPGFNQVAMLPRNRKPFKRFPSLMEHSVTWLKPGVNEKKPRILFSIRY
jgi:hypothetical protein